MSNEMTDITSKLQQYDEAFDFYMDRGQLPESIPQSDLLGGFISQTIQDNPQLESQDPIWVEILKDELMKFIEAMLKLFQPIEKSQRHEKALIAAFASGETDKKRALWKQSYQYHPYIRHQDSKVRGNAQRHYLLEQETQGRNRKESQR